MQKKTKSIMICWALLYASSAVAQTVSWDTSGNALLNGSYNFRQVFYHAATTTGNLDQGYAVYGTIVFDGTGHYNLQNTNLLTYTTGTGTTKALSATGTYSIAANGYGFLDGLYCPLSAGCTKNTLYVMVASGLLMGSSTEGGFNDLFIGAQAPTTQATTASFTGNWMLAGFVPTVGGGAGSNANLFFSMSPNGSGSLGTVNVTGYLGSNTGTQTIQTQTGVTYTFSGGVGVMNFPGSGTPTSFLTGTEDFFLSSDGSFFVGGSTSTPDIIVGVQSPAAGAAQTFSGFYYDAGLDENEHFLTTSNFADFDTYYGSFNISGTNLIEGDRVLDLSSVIFDASAASSSFAEVIPASVTGGTYTNPGLTNYAFNSSGSIRIGAGIGPYLSFNVAGKAQTLTGSGVYLNPMGVSNAASFAPFTTGISPGEAIVLYGSGMATGNTNAPSLPLTTNLGGTSVTINGIAAPLYYVQPTQIAALVPYGVTGPVAQIQVSNNGTTSNTVTTFVRTTTPGVYTLPSGGVGAAAAEHANGTVVSSNSPAIPGETLEIYVSGLGAVSPGVTDGAAAPLAPLSKANAGILGFYAYVISTPSFAGLTPTLAGLYQVNVAVPATAPPGTQLIEIDGPDSESAEATVPIVVGGGAETSSTLMIQPARNASRTAMLAAQR